MELRERTALIAEIARRKQTKPGRLGKTAIMKLLHILQDGFGAPLGYRFSLYNYGPYDSEVMSDIDFAESLGQVSVEYLAGDQGYAVRPGAESRQVSFGDRSIATKIDQLMSAFGSFNARELELRSTLLFLSREFQDESLVTRLRDLKPKYSEAETRAAIRELVTLGLAGRGGVSHGQEYRRPVL